MARKKIKRSPGPWRVVFKQVNEMGVGSRPYLVDAKGETVSFNEKGNARLASLAPSMLEALQKVEHEARLWYLIIKDDHPGIAKPTWLVEVQRLIFLADSIA